MPRYIITHGSFFVGRLPNGMREEKVAGEVIELDAAEAARHGDALKLANESKPPPPPPAVKPVASTHKK